MRTLKNFFRTDFSEYKDFLLKLKKDTPLSEEDKSKLVDILNEKDPVAETKGKWSVDKVSCAKVVYSGNNNPHLPAHPLYEKIVGIQICDETRIYLNIDRKV